MYRVITIDDEPMVKKMLGKLIDATERFKVVAEAEDGLEALRLIEQHAPDLILTDIRMPIMDGLELLQELHMRNQKPKVVILSGYDDFTFAQQAIRYGASEYLLKPIRPALLQETLDRIFISLEQEKLSLSDRGRWILLVKSHAESINENVWILNEDAAIDDLKKFNETLQLEATEESQIRTAYFELICHIDASLNEKGIHMFNQDMDDPIPVKTEELFNHTSSLMESAIQQIRQSRNWGSHQGIQRAADYIKQNYTLEAFSMQEVADYIHMSPAYFSRSFKEEMGVSFIHFLTQLRIEMAKEMLANPACKTVNIPHAIGYADYPHFAKVFKKYCGLTPTEYRKRLGVQ